MRKRVQYKGGERMKTQESQMQELRRVEATNAENRVLAGTRGERRCEHELRIT